MEHNRYSNDQCIITYGTSGNGNSETGSYETTNTVPTVGGTIAQPGTTFNDRRHAVLADLDAGNAPTFTNLGGSVTVLCFAATLGDVVYTVTATDADPGDTLTTTLDSVTPSSHFAFDSATGEVSVSSSSITLTTYTLTFSVSDGCSSATDTLAITVSNSAPYFSNLDAVMTSTSNLALGTVLYTVTSVDDDSGSGDSVTTALTSTSPTADFTFDATTGEVSVATTPLTIGTYTLTFSITDTCGQSSTNTLTVTVYNQAPVITSLPTTVDVREDVTSLTLLHTVTSSDADGHSVSCTISSTSPASAPFSIKYISNGTTLENGIYLNANAGLDYSSVDTYTLSIECSDGYDSDTESLYVYIVENGMPLISNLQSSTTVSTTTSISSEVFVVQANDTEGDALSYSLTCVNTGTCPFAIYSTGSILLSTTLLGTTTLAYELDITVSDAYSVTAAHRLTVFVSDLNTAPVLANLPQTIQVSEDTTPGTSLFLLSVYDEDGDSTFTIDVGFTPTTGATRFVVDDAALTVSLSTSQGLDYETQTEYTLNLTASDEKDTSSWALLTIQVADVNESPQLLKTYYYISENEGSAGTSFTVPVMLVSDPDLGDSLTFSMGDASDPGCGLLSVNSTTGVMGYETNFDVDDTSLSSYFSCPVKVEDTGGLAVTATVTVSIQDVNDNQPQFSTHTYVLSARQSAQVGTTLATLTVLDDDLTSVNRQSQTPGAASDGGRGHRISLGSYRPP
ncbi:cadherin EGF LAG seven-pass G-type receptor 1-like [Babylonia areolata]|uniref:cadherin EGF LAG seven-pass G-type receptor 1-like n=1 Tax=Babylonia areolata TaxID=304850 RepID=UPI003FD5BD5D